MKTKAYIGTRGVAVICGITESTVRGYKADGRLPQPEVTIDGTPGWSEGTIRRWQDSRPGLNRRPFSRIGNRIV